MQQVQRAANSVSTGKVGSWELCITFGGISFTTFSGNKSSFSSINDLFGVSNNNKSLECEAENIFPWSKLVIVRNDSK